MTAYLKLTKDSFIAAFVSSEYADVSRNENYFFESLTMFCDNPTDTPTRETCARMADSLISDSRDDLSTNWEYLILMSDRSDEYTTDPDDPGWNRLDEDLQDWLGSEEMYEALTSTYWHAYEFHQTIKALRESLTKND